LRADGSAQVYLTAFFQNLKEDLHLALITQGMEQKVIQNKECCPANLLQPPLVLSVVSCFERNKLLQKDLAVMVLDLVIVT
jgi:hypothetical protein